MLPHHSIYVLALLASAGMAQVPLHIHDGFEYGVSPNAGFGTAVTGVGDFDGDGQDDIAVGAPLEDVGGAIVGRVRVLSGRDGSVLQVIDGTGLDASFGQALASPGDVDLDGWPDLLVGAPNTDFTGQSSGSAWVYSGRSGALLFVFIGLGYLDYYGTAVAGAGHVDADPFPDFLIGAPKYDALGYAEVRSGRDGTLLYRVHGTGDRWYFGWSLCGAGDLDGDGLDDVVVGERQSPQCCGGPGPAGPGPYGEVFAFMGPTGASRKSVVMAIPGADFGSSVARIGDLTGDGRAEILIGAAGFSSSAIPKHAFVWDTVPNALIRVHTVTLVNAEGPWEFGATSACPGDMNGDNVPDYAVGAGGDWFNGLSSGSVFVYSGSDGALLYRVLNLGDSACDRFGSSLADAGDSDGDGLGDLAIGAPYDSPYGNCPTGGYYHDTYGRVMVFSAAPPSASSYCTAKVNSQGCTPTIASSGAPNPSGPDDFVVQASSIINQKSGLLVWSLAAAAKPFGGGVLCVESPLKRTPVLSSKGNPGPPDCSGSFQFHFTHVYLWSNLLLPGTQVYAQFLYRDPKSPTGPVGATDGLEWMMGF